MYRNFYKLVLTLAITACCAQSASAQPSPANCTVTPADALGGLVVCGALPAPLNESVLRITIRDAANVPLPNETVFVTLNGTNPVCPAAVLSGVTNGLGEVRIIVAAGGCTKNTAGAATIATSSGVLIRSYRNVKSPDFDGATSDGVVNLADLIQFATEFNGTAPPACHDYNNDSIVNLIDLIAMGAAFSRLQHC